MSLPQSVKTCLVLTYGPVPTPQYQTVEGGGMRAWGLAQGLKRNGIDVTIGVNNSFPQELREHEGVRLTNWGLDAHFADLINTYDAVVISYCMGDESVFVAEHIDGNVQLILDAYVPIYVEVSARESADIGTEYSNYMADIRRYNRVLRRGDYFLCASERQRTFYIGVLAALGIINPRSYRQERILIAPFGIHDTPAEATRNPYRELGIKPSDFTVMWFGGLYPWFRIEELLNAVLEMSELPDFKFVVVGGKNPFNPNPDFFRQYERAQAFAAEHGLLNKSFFFVDWVDFDDRINWYKHADVVVSLNQPGEENGFAWRTRVMDFVWGELAIVTNGGDPLSEDLVAADAALRLETLSASALAAALRDVHDKPATLRAIHKRVVALKPNYYWHNLMAPVAALIAAGETPYADENAFRHNLRVSLPGEAATDAAAAVPAIGPTGKLYQARRAVRLGRRAVTYARRKGLKRSARLALTIAQTQARSRLAKRGRQFVFISHPMDHTGAPVVLMQMIREYAEKYGGRAVHLVAPHVDPAHLRNLREMGIKVDKAAAHLPSRLIRTQLGLRKDDFVLINTIAVYDNYRDFVLGALESGRLAHAYWFIHEDKAQVPVINRDLLHKRTVGRVRKLAGKGKLTIATPSKQTQTDWQDLLGTKAVQTVPLLVDVPAKYCQPRPARDYHKVDFFIAGTAADGRKGQVLAIAALNDFLTRHYQAHPERYRNFKLHLLSIDNDYVSQQVRWLSQSLLGKHVRLYEPMPRAQALATAATCNAVICCSLNETFGLYVAEGMFMGHVVLRNNSAGMAEQLHNGVNGFFIDHHDIHQFADVIEKVLNKKTLSDEQLQQMGAASQQIIGEFAKNNYLEKIEALK